MGRSTAGRASASTMLSTAATVTTGDGVISITGGVVQAASGCSCGDKGEIQG